jgi:hypothetical protein
MCTPCETRQRRDDPETYFGMSLLHQKSDGTVFPAEWLSATYPEIGCRDGIARRDRCGRMMPRPYTPQRGTHELQR